MTIVEESGTAAAEAAGWTKDTLVLWRAPGCRTCAGTGEQGRVALHEMLAVFDFPDPNLSIGGRTVSTLSTQALYMMNSPLVMDQARSAAQQVLEATQPGGQSLDDNGRIMLLYQRALQRPPSEAEWSDVRHGLEVAHTIGRFDIGQSVVIRQGTVVAVEGIEGTDATIRRAGSLVRGDFVVVKVCKPTQDRRFDLPAIGAQTVQAMCEAGARVLAVEAGRTVMLDREAMIAAADAADVSIVAVEAGTP